MGTTARGTDHVGGGQPSDTGLLTFSNANDPDNSTSSKSFRVEMCLRRKLDSIHLVRVLPEDEAFFSTLQAGQGVRVDLNWERRVDQVYRVSLVTHPSYVGWAAQGRGGPDRS